MTRKYRNHSRIWSLAIALALSVSRSGWGQEENADTSAAVTKEQFENLKGQVESLNEGYLVTKTTVDKLAKIKVSGYIQAQWQYADSNGAAMGTMAGGGFPANSNQRLQVRRARLKTVYDNVTSQYVLELEARPSGVSLKDVEIILNEPWLKTFSLAMGLMDRPFGFEVGYSSSAHEAPERTRLYQTMFKDEKDLGVKLEANPTEQMGLLQYFNFKGGLYTGTAGYNGGTGDEIDSTLDVIARLGTKVPVYALNLAVDGGVSLYSGKSLNLSDSAYTMSDTGFALSRGNNKQRFDRNAYGLDAQVYYTIPLIGDLLGGTSLRGEYVWGRTPGTLAANGPYGATGAGTPIAVRDFSGWYVTLLQNLGEHAQAVVKYDEFDPNTKVKGDEILGLADGKNRYNLGPADLKYKTLGLGLIYYWTETVRLSAYYDMVTNETVNGATPATFLNGTPATAKAHPLYAYTADLKDNVLTARVQVKF
jgi:hypothetical protein